AAGRVLPSPVRSSLDLLQDECVGHERSEQHELRRSYARARAYLGRGLDVREIGVDALSQLQVLADGEQLLDARALGHVVEDVEVDVDDALHRLRCRDGLAQERILSEVALVETEAFEERRANLRLDGLPEVVRV